MTKTTSCPICRGEIHSIAGRCKHCKADLVELRERAARAARAQAMGATVPPPPRQSGTFAAPATWPPGPAPALPPAAGFESPPGGGDTSPGATLVDHPAEPLPFGQERASSPYAAPPPSFGTPPSPGTPPSRGTPPYGLGFAGARADRLSTWSRRWPFLVGAVALLAIGASIGVLAERWRQQGAGRAERGSRHSDLSRRPGMVPDHMPLPLMPPPPARPAPDPAPASPVPPSPATPAPSPDPPAPQPVPAPDPSNPGSRFSQPTPSDPDTEASAFRRFTTALTESLCQKLTQCGLIDSAAQVMCREFGHELGTDETAEKVARGECSFNQRAADACLRAVADLRCDVGSSDRLMDWLVSPTRVGECAEAYACQ